MAMKDPRKTRDVHIIPTQHRQLSKKASPSHKDQICCTDTNANISSHMSYLHNIASFQTRRALVIWRVFATNVVNPNARRTRYSYGVVHGRFQICIIMYRLELAIRRIPDNTDVLLQLSLNTLFLSHRPRKTCIRMCKSAQEEKAHVCQTISSFQRLLDTLFPDQ